MRLSRLSFFEITKGTCLEFIEMEPRISDCFNIGWILWILLLFLNFNFVNTGILHTNCDCAILSVILPMESTAIFSITALDTSWEEWIMLWILCIWVNAHMNIQWTALTFAFFIETPHVTYAFLENVITSRPAVIVIIFDALFLGIIPPFVWSAFIFTLVITVILHPDRARKAAFPTPDFLF